MCNLDDKTPLLIGHALSKEELTDQVTNLMQQLEVEKRRNLQLTLLSELSQQLGTSLNQSVAAQITVNMLEQAISSPYVGLHAPQLEQREFVALAFAGTLISAKSE